MREHFLTTYIRTKTVFKHRLKDLKDYETVEIYNYELNKLGVVGYELLYHLRERGEITFEHVGKFPSKFRVLRRGPTEPDLLDKTKRRDKVKAPLSELHLWMRDQLKLVSVVCDHSKLSVYFKSFLEHKDRSLDAFFSVDSFSGRVHSPVVNLKGDLRLSLRLGGKKVTSLDVKQMQPTILAKVLLLNVGDNAFSTAIFNGEDVYVLLQSRNKNLRTRGDAKKFLYKLIFGRPMDDLGRWFEGDTGWVDWINHYKSKTEPKNPHKEDMHTNLAWLLQFSEVQVMSEIWQKLKDGGIPFLTIHDDVLCREVDKDIVYDIMNGVLKTHFKRFFITVNH